MSVVDKLVLSDFKNKLPVCVDFINFVKCYNIDSKILLVLLIGIFRGSSFIYFKVKFNY